MLKHIDAGVLNIAYLEHGPAHGWPCVLLHGFPYDVHAYVEVIPYLVEQGAHVIVPYLRGFGSTCFRSGATPRSGQQAALGSDLLALLDACKINKAVLAGYDWGGRAACIVAALWPERVTGLVSGNGYLIQNIARAAEPGLPENEMRLWYQYYFHSERGRVGLQRNRRDFARLCWQLWSPNWRFDDATFNRSASAFENPDFVDISIHSYRHRHGLAAGDPDLAPIEAALALQPEITVPAITLDGTADGVIAIGSTAHQAKFFTGRHAHYTIEGVGHNLPQEAPVAFAQAAIKVQG
jgi:pimeloyl-ACP methyl ester carboxylesterase